MNGSLHHPCRNDDGEAVVIHRPSSPTALTHWKDCGAQAIAVPACLAVRLQAFLVDVRRTQTYTRYYVAKRIGGCPSAMGWETQAVHLVPAARLADVAVHPNDAAIIRALRDWMSARD